MIALLLIVIVRQIELQGIKGGNPVGTSKVGGGLL
jgi:hypothetical protein